MCSTPSFGLPGLFKNLMKFMNLNCPVILTRPKYGAKYQFCYINRAHHRIYIMTRMYCKFKTTLISPNRPTSLIMFHRKGPLHNCRWRASHYGKNIWSFWYKNLLFHKGKQDQKWSSGVPYCSLLLIWWKDRKLSKKNNEIVSLRSNPQDKEHFCLPNTKTGLKPCGFASRKVVWQKSITSLFWCLEYFIS